MIEQIFLLAPRDARWARAFGGALLAWWETEGRRDPAQKPWMFKADGLWPEPDDALDPYGIWIAEVMRAARQHCPPLPNN